MPDAAQSAPRTPSGRARRAPMRCASRRVLAGRAVRRLPRARRGCRRRRARPLPAPRRARARMADAVKLGSRKCSMALPPPSAAGMPTKPATHRADGQRHQRERHRRRATRADRATAVAVRRAAACACRRIVPCARRARHACACRAHRAVARVARACTPPRACGRSLTVRAVGSHAGPRYAPKKVIDIRRNM